MRLDQSERKRKKFLSRSAKKEETCICDRNIAVLPGLTMLYRLSERPAFQGLSEKSKKKEAERAIQA
jgi:hypothetical protein